MADAGASLWVPLIIGALSAGGAAYSSSEQSRQSEIAQNEAEERQRAYNEEVQAANLKYYQENAYPTDKEIEAERAAGLKTLGSDRVKRLDQLSRTSALRGLGSGSGVISQGAGEIEGSYLEGLGSLSSSLSKLANTPKSGFTFPYLSGTTASSGISGANSGYSSYATGGSNSSNPLGTALGYMMGKSGSLFGNSDNTSSYADIPFTDYTDWSNSIYG